LSDTLRVTVDTRPHRTALSFLKDGVDISDSLDYAALDERARAIAVHVARHHPPGSRLLLLYPPGLAVVAGFLGCLYAACVAIPVPPPDAARLKRTLPRLLTIARDAGACGVLSTVDIQSALRVDEYPDWHGLSWILTDQVETGLADDWIRPALTADSLAYLQYTSGSTSAPKGVMITHGQVMQNLAALQQAFGYDADSLAVTWLPYFHDYGLVEGLLQPLFSGATGYVLSPLTFLKRPLRWLQALSRFGGTHSQGPNFAYEHCLARISPEERDRLDLSPVRCISMGAEPIRQDTVSRFADYFAPTGLKRTALYPAYGLAEATLGVTGKTPDTLPGWVYVKTLALSQNRVEPCDATHTEARAVVNCGRPMRETVLRIVDPDTRRPLPAERIGELWMRAPGVGSGYWQKPEETADTFQATLATDESGLMWLRTGDLGFLQDGEFYFTGRLKDLIIIDGANHYPQDIEWTVLQSHSALRPEHCVAFSVSCDNGSEGLVVLVEIERDREAVATVCECINQAVVDTHQIACAHLLILKKGSILKTSSGKLQRRACRERFLTQGFSALLHWPRPAAIEATAELIAPDRFYHWLAGRLGVAADRFDPRRTFADYGLGSRAAVSLMGELECWLGNGQELSPLLPWQYPTPTALLAYLSAQDIHPAQTVASGSSGQVAIIGLACRFPGAASPRDFWTLIREGADAVGEIPDERWHQATYFDVNPSTPGKTVARRAGLLPLTSITDFDPACFSITPREAASMDPQHRLLLELGVEALEDAGLPPRLQAGRPIGVFIGISTSDYADQVYHDPAALNPYSAQGRAHSMAANRLSYHFDFRGPSLAVDTACSSSLTALHLACQGLQAGECELALVGGVNLLLSPLNQVALSQAGMLSPTGYCRTFDARADGYVRGEGAALVVLKPLAQALRDGDPIQAVIAGHAVNQDGHSNGLTAPNGLAQQAVMRAALQQAGTDPQQIGLIEAHGTGTALGDPIEFSSIQAVYAGQFRQQDSTVMKPLPSCALGSVKTNIGHLEAAAGVAGLMKLVLALRARVIPPHPHLQTVNPLLSLSDNRFFIPQQAMPWPETPGGRMAALSSFGFGGSNAHVLLQEAPTVTAAASDTRHWHCLPLSARTVPALRTLMQRYLAWLEQPEGSLADLCHTAATGRDHGPVRRAFVADGFDSLRRALQVALAEPESAPAAVSVNPLPRIAFLLTGQGSQYVNMGRSLHAVSPVFRAAFDRCAQWAEPRIPHWHTLYPAETSGQAEPGTLDTVVTQVGLFAVEYALAHWWQALGISPALLLGHSLGEYVAACLAGVFSLDEALTLVEGRARLMAALPDTGGMLAVRTHAASLAALMNEAPGVVVAAENGPARFVLSGQVTALARIEAVCRKQGIETRRLTVNQAFHSPLLDPMLEPFRVLAARIQYQMPQVPIVSNLTGKLADASMTTPDYWVDHTRSTVRFAQGVETLRQAGVDIYLEIGPQAHLIPQVSACYGTHALPLCVPSLKHGQPDWAVLLQAIAALYESGINPDWSILDQESGYRRQPGLPTSPFERIPCWLVGTDAPCRATTCQQPDTCSTPVMSTPAVTDTTVTAAPLEAILARLLAQVTGLAADTLKADANLFETGLDSLVLVQFQRAIQRQFKVEISLDLFHQSLNTLTRIATHLASHGPTVVETPVQAQPQVSPSAAVSADSGDTLAQVMRMQLQTLTEVMTRQLAVFGQGTASLPVSMPSPPASNSVIAPSLQARPVGSIPGLYRQMRTEMSADWSADKAAYVAELARIYNQRTARSKAYAADSRPVFAHYRNAAFRPEWKELVYQIALDRASGSRVYDIDGNEYIDINMGYGVTLFGHDPDFVKQAVAQELARGGLAIGPLSRVVGEVAALLCEITGCERASPLFNTGSEAVMVAVRLARAVTGRSKIVLFSGAYHGSFDGVLAVGWASEAETVTYPMAPGIPQSLVDDVIVLKYGDDEALRLIEILGSQLAAVLVEPVQSRFPELQPGEFLKKLRQLTEASGTALIFDEMIMGFRLHPGGSQAHFGVQADILTYGKILGGGLPIGAVAGKARFMDAVDGGLWQYGDDSVPTTPITFVAGTFNMHPLSMVAARAVLLELKRQGPALQASLNQRTRDFCEALNTWYRSEQLPIEMIYCGSLFRFKLSGELELLFYHLLLRGIYLWEGRNCFLSTAHTEADLQTIRQAIKDSIADMRNDGWLPPAAGASWQPPLSEGQKALWSLIRLQPAASRAYTETVGLHLTGPVEAAHLETALNQLIARHALLRCTRLDGERHQVVATLRLALPWDGLTLADWLERHPLADFPLEPESVDPSLPLLHVQALRPGPDQVVLLLSLPHLLADGWSLGILMQEWLSAYQALQSGVEPSWPEPGHYTAFVNWSRSLSVGLAADIAWWQAYLHNPPPALELPADHPRPAQPSYRGGRRSLTLDARTTHALRDGGRQRGAGFFALLLTVAEVWLAALSGQDEFFLCIPVAGQLVADLPHLVGHASANLPLRVKLNRSESLAVTLVQQQSNLLQAQAHQKALFAAGFAETLSWPPLTTVFNLDRAMALNQGDLRVEVTLPFRGYCKNDLFINLLETDDGLQVDVDFSLDLFDPARMETWIEALGQLLQCVSQEWDTRLDTLIEPVPAPPPPPAAGVMIHGYRVDPRSLEDCLARYPGMDSVRVVLWPSANGQTLRLAAFVAGRVTPDELRTWLQRQVPPHLQAARIMVTEQPDTRPEADLLALLDEPDRIDDPVVAALASLWSELLGVTSVAAEDSFLALGGNSLKALQLEARIERAFGVRIGLAELLAAPTCAAQAGLIQAISSAPDGNHTALLPPIPIPPQRDYPLSPAQKRLWIIDALQPGVAAYNVPAALVLHSVLDIRALARALQALIERHEILRTRFVQVDDNPRQRVDAWQPARLECIHWETEAEAGAELDDWLRDMAETPFDLSRDSLMRCALLCWPDRQVLALNLHHIISDLWSMEILLRDLFTLYQAYRDGSADSLPPLPIQYRDYAVWQWAALEQPPYTRQRDYWLQQLNPVPRPLDLIPADRRPPVRRHQGVLIERLLPAALVERLDALCQRQAVTPFMLFVALCEGFLAALTGADDLCLGTVVSGRSRPETHELIGFFVNTLAIRDRIERSESFLAHLARVRTTLLAAYAHQDYPFDALLDALRPPRQAGRNPLFDIMVALEDRAEVGQLAERFGFTLREVEVPGSQFDLTFTLGLPEPGNWLVSVVYDSDLFDRPLILTWIEQFEAYVLAVTTHPEWPLSESMCAIRSAEPPPMAHYGPQVVVPTLAVHRLLEIHAAREPEVPAVWDVDECNTVPGAASSLKSVISRGELNLRANRLAHYLCQCGAGSECRVAVGLPRSSELVVALLGILKAGAAYLPLDPGYPPQRLAYLLADSGAGLLLTHSSLRNRWPDTVTCLYLDELEPALVDKPGHNPMLEPQPDHLAYLIYTSGSTGQPKGVAVEHRSLTNKISSFCDSLALGSQCRAAVLASPAFDPCLEQILAPLAAGGSILMIPDAIRQNPELLWPLLVTQQINYLDVVPTYLNAILPALTVTFRPQYLICGGEALQTATLKALQSSLLKPRHFLNLYGPTEACIDAVGHWIDLSTDIGDEVPIGQPLANYLVYVLDERLKAVTKGDSGELYIGGIGLARGYPGRAEQEASHFITPPFPVPGGRLYKTGDRVRYNSEGDLVFLGRVDQQVKIRGFRVELAEIEAVLASHPAVRHALARLDDSGEHPRLLVYYLTGAEPSTLAAELKSLLRSRLPDYMQPAALIGLEAFPVTLNGKVDTARLPLPDQASVVLAKPSSAAEAVLTDIWQHLLKYKVIGSEDNFFELGGDSILAIQVASRAREQGWQLTPNQVFEHQTLASLARHCARRQVPGGETAPSPGSSSTRLVREDYFPLTPTQEGMLFQTLKGVGEATYFGQIVLSFAASPELHHWQAAWREVLQRHVALRVAVVWRGRETPAQRIAREFEPEWVIRDWREYTAEQFAHHWEAYLQQDRQRGFDVEQAPLLRFTLALSADGGCRFAISEHHLLNDGWGIAIVVREVMILYRARVAGTAVTLPPAPDYRDYLDWIARQSRDEALAYWTDYLRELPPSTPLPGSGWSTETAVAGDYPVHRLPIPPVLGAGIRAAAAAWRVTPNTLFQAGWALLLAAHAQSDEVVFGVTVSGRPADLPGVEDMVGLFINTLPLRVSLSDDTGLAEWLRGLQSRHARLSGHAYSSGADWPIWAGRPAGTVLFESILVYENFPVADVLLRPDPGGFNLLQVVVHEHNHYPLTLLVVPEGEGFLLQLTREARCLGAGAAERILTRFSALLTSLQEAAHAHLSPRELLERWHESSVDVDLTARATTPLSEDF